MIQAAGWYNMPYIQQHTRDAITSGYMTKVLGGTSMKNIISGIYEIRNTVNGHRYIGSAKNISDRWSCHKSQLRKGSHHSKYLQRAWDKYGEDAFEFSIIETCFHFALLFREQHYINTLSPEYNINPTAGSNLGKRFSEDVRKNMSTARIGKTPWNKGLKGVMVAWNKGLKGVVSLSEETRQKMSVSRKGKPGKALSQETKDKIGNANRDKPKPHSEEHKRNQSEAAKRQWKRQKGDNS